VLKHPRSALLSLIVSLCVACSSAPRDAAGEGGEDALIGGRAAGTRYAAVGALTDPDGAVFCTATLVSPRLIVTAQHCIEGGSEDEPADRAPSEVTFRLGAKASAPDRAPVKLKRWLPAPTFDTNGDPLSHFASDVALAELAEPITDRAPIPLATRAPSDSDLGQSFDVVGFGVRDKSGTGEPGGIREVGSFKLEAVAGNAFHKRFGSKEEFDRHLASIDAEGAADGLGDRLYAYGELHDGYEVLARSERSETCYSDSGGPLLATKNGKLEVIGVVSRGFPGYASSCTHLGTVFAVFGPRTAAFLSSNR
jgi:hypothetical protein